MDQKDNTTGGRGEVTEVSSCVGWEETDMSYKLALESVGEKPEKETEVSFCANGEKTKKKRHAGLSV